MIALWFCVLLLVSYPALAQPGATVVDGDGLHFGVERVRLWGIDAPERDQTCVVAQAPYPCGRQAAQALKELVQGKAVGCDKVDTDRYGRTVARCSADGLDLGGRLPALFAGFLRRGGGRSPPGAPRAVGRRLRAAGGLAPQASPPSAERSARR